MSFESRSKLMSAEAVPTTRRNPGLGVVTGMVGRRVAVGVEMETSEPVDGWRWGRGEKGRKGGGHQNSLNMQMNLIVSFYSIS